MIETTSSHLAHQLVQHGSHLVRLAREVGRCRHWSVEARRSDSGSGNSGGKRQCRPDRRGACSMH